ncbi:MAG: phosphoglycolate phosphatase [Pigmentiphaga sp.]
MAIQAVLIDLDGTLVDSIPDLAEAANAMRVELGLPVLPVAEIARYVGKGMHNLVQRAMLGQLELPPAPPPGFEQALAVFQRAYHRVNGQCAQVYPGVETGLQRLKEQGLRLAVVTNKPTAFTLPLLEQLGLDGYFDAVVAGDTVARKKPDPLPLLHACALLGVPAERALMIGDSMNDALAAEAAGCKVLLLPYGYNEGRDVRSLKSDGIVGSIVEAADWLASAALSTD